MPVLQDVRGFRWLAGSGVVVLMSMVFAAPAWAQAPHGAWANWTAGGGSGVWTGTAVPAAGFPVARLTSNATTVTTPTGASAFLGPATPIGAAYGSSQLRNYLNISTAAGFSASTTTWRFDAPAPGAHWAFAVGDVDADRVRMSATGADGAPVPVAALGFQGVFNYCGVSPRPSSCAGPGPFTDVPNWDAGTGTLTGNVLDTFGASAWFQPTVPIAALTFTFTRQVGAPVVQLWLASQAVPVTAHIGGATPQSGVHLQLNQPGGGPVLDDLGNPVIATPDPSGTAAFPDVAEGDYVVSIVLPPGAVNQGAQTVAITVAFAEGGVTIPAGTFTVEILPDTGRRIGAIAQIGAMLVLAGLLLAGLSTRRRMSERP